MENNNNIGTGTKLALITLGGLLCSVVLLGIGTSVSRTGKVAITIEVAPSVADVRVDNKPVGQGKVYMSKGKHTLVASLANFTGGSQSFTVGDKARPISLVLDPANADGQKFLSDHPNYQLEREAIGSQQKEGLSMLDQTPLIGLLPVVNISGPYKIDYGQSSQRQGGTVIIISDSSPEGRQKALAWIRKQGFNPTDLEIEYADFVNHLTSGARAQ